MMIGLDGPESFTETYAFWSLLVGSYPGHHHFIDMHFQTLPESLTAYRLSFQIRWSFPTRVTFLGMTILQFTCIIRLRITLAC